MVDRERRFRLGELLIAKGLISEGQLAEALGAERSAGERIGETLVRLGLVKRRQISAALAEQFVRRFFAAIGITALALNSGSAAAGSVRTQMSVSVTILNVATASIKTAGAGPPGTGTASVQLACTSGGPARIGVEHGRVDLAAPGSGGAAAGYVVTWRSNANATITCGSAGQSVTAPLELAADRNAAAAGGVQAATIVIAY
jgi:hypothetical protein